MENIKKLRKQHHLSQQQLADILHISQQSVYKYEKDITSPDIETLANMADYFNTSIDYLVGYTDIPHKIESVTESMLNKNEMTLVTNYRKLTPKQKSAIYSVIESYIDPISNGNS